VSGTSIIIEAQGMQRLQQRLNSLANPNRHALLELMGAEVESQTRRRIESEKSAPDGERWQAWSDGYAETRHSGQSLLSGEGDLLDSMTFDVSGNDVFVGSNKVYAAIHQFGGAEVGMNIPARPFLGLSDSNESELLGVVDGWLDQQMGAA